MMNYEKMTGAELLAELSHMEQLGHAGDMQAWEIREELKTRKEQAQNAFKYPVIEETITFGKHAEATINYKKGEITFVGYEGGAKCMIKPIWNMNEKHVGYFYGSEYLTNGIIKRVKNALGF